MQQPDPLSMVAHPELDFPDCLAEFYRGVVFAYQRSIEEFADGWIPDLPRNDTAHLRDAVNWLEGQVEKYRKKAEEVQSS